MGAIKDFVSHKLKEKQVKELISEMKDAKTIMVVSIRGLPSKQFQEIKKKLRDKGNIKVAKKNIFMRSLEGFGKPTILSLEQDITDNCALFISDFDGFELAGVLNENKNPMFAKAGQVSPCDIEVPEGPTTLMPGPAISELSSLGIQIAVEGGKIAIKKPKGIVKTGEVIKPNVAAVLQKLNIQPFRIGLEPVTVYDVQTEKIYRDIKIDSEGVAIELKTAASKSLGFAQKIGYYCKDTIGYFLAKANMQGEHLAQLNKPEESA